MAPSTSGQRRKIHVDLPEEIHKKLRVKAALEDMSMQAFVSHIVGEAVKEVKLPRISSIKGEKRDDAY